MLRDVVRRSRRRRWAQAPVIHATSHFYHEKKAAWVSISMHACDPVPIVMGLRLAALPFPSALPLLRECETCKREHEKSLGTPPEAGLPDFRVREATPFAKVGVDFSGPLFTKSQTGEMLTLPCSHVV